MGFNLSIIRGMAYKEKYIGDALFQKTYTDEHFNHRRNNGEKEQYLIQNHHEPIFSREDFEAAQAVIAQRAKEKGIEKREGKSQNRYPFSGKIICGNCAAPLSAVSMPAGNTELRGVAPRTSRILPSAR